MRIIAFTLAALVFMCACSSASPEAPVSSQPLSGQLRGQAFTPHGAATLAWIGPEPRIVVEVLEEEVTCDDVEEKTAVPGIAPGDTTQYPVRRGLQVILPWPARPGEAWALGQGDASVGFEFDRRGYGEDDGASSGRLEIVRVDAASMTLRLRAEGKDGSVEGQLDVVVCPR
jgi:hypothetical protein